MKAIIFARVSSKDQEEGKSIPAQVRRLTEYALKKNFKIESTFQITESSSKETRKQFNQIIAHVKKTKEPIALITDTVDRLQRSFRETPLLDELRRQGKLELHFLREGLVINQDSNSAQLLQWDVGVLFASSYVRQLGDNVKRSQEQCIKNGQWISKAPYGYKNITLPSGEKDIIIDELQAPFVTKIFELYAKGNNSFQTIAVKMREQNFAKTSRGKSVTARTIELILKNPFYMGKMRIKNKLYPHKYEILISEQLFNKVQDTIANHHKVPVQYAGKPILFRGLITCKNCGCAVTGDIKKQKYIYYSCHNSKRICTKKWVREEVLLKELLSHFDMIQLSDQQIDETVDYLRMHEEQEQDFIKKSQRLINESLNLTQERISKLIDMHIDGKIDSDTYHFKLEEYKREQQKLTLELKSYGNNNKEEVIAAQEVLELTKEAKEIFMSSNLDGKQQLLRCFFSNLELDREKLHVELREPFKIVATVQDQHIWRS
ncbi:recombinase family protein [Candidatus Dependentiae bacterium]